jgi:CheY-like chemotaxis protein
MLAPQLVLLVEDNPRDAELAIAALAEEHLVNDVVHVRDGAEALDYLHRRGPYASRTTGQPAVVLLDLNMPRVDGLEVLRQMKANPALSTIPVVVMTSSREEQALLDSYKGGAVACVFKPVRFGELLRAVARAGGFWALLEGPADAEAFTSQAPA